jgi:hypothetical protein
VYKNQIHDLHEDPKKGWKNESFTFVWGKKPILLQHNVRPHNNAATSRVTRQHKIQCCFTNLPTAQIWHLLSCGCLQL